MPAFHGGPAPACSAVFCPCAENPSTETPHFPRAACPLRCALGKDQTRELESGACQHRVTGLPWDTAPAVGTGTYDGMYDDLHPKTSGTEGFRAICEGTTQRTAPTSRGSRGRGGRSPPPAAPHRTAPPRGWGPPAGRGRARGGPGAALPAGPRGTAAAAAAAEPESGRGGRHGSGAEPGAVSGAGGRGFLGARRCGGSALLSEGFVVCLFFFLYGR